MIWNEFRKIWNPYSLILISVIGVTLLYSWVAGQMNLKYLPIFETVELEIGEELHAKYGDELDSAELQEIEKLYDEARKDLNEKVLRAHPELMDMGYQSYEELEQYDTFYDDSEDTLEDRTLHEKASELYFQISDEFAYEIATCNTYQSIAVKNNIMPYRDVEQEKNMHLKKRLTEIQSRDTVSVLPYQVTSNMGFVMEDYASITMYLIILLVFPFLAMDNKRKVYPVVATTKTGRRLIIYQMIVMLLSVILLLIVWNTAFYLVYQRMTPYEPYEQCLVPDLWFDWTWSQYFRIWIGLLDICAIAFAMVLFFLSSICKTIVGTVAMALPCLGVGEIISLYFFPKIFRLPNYSSLYDITVGQGKYFPVVAEILMLLLGVVLLICLYHNRKVQDIAEE